MKFSPILFLVTSFLLIKGQTNMGWCQFNQAPDSLVYGLSIFNGSMVATGQFKNAGSTPAKNIALYNGVNWNNLGAGLRGGINASAYETFEHNNQLYVVGNFDSCGTTACNDIAKWDGSSWSAVGLVSPVSTCTLYAGIVFNTELVVGGIFTTFGGVPAINVAKFNGSSWQALGSGLNGSYVSDLIVFQNKLYAVGSFSLNGNPTTFNIAVWDGTTWASVSTGLLSPALAMEIYNNKLLIGGGTGSSFEIKQFDGLNLTTHSTCSINPVREFHQFNNRLILVGGLFGQTSQSYEYKPATNSWEQLGYGLNMFTRGITDYNGDLYIGGKFNNQGGSNFNYMAKACDVTGFTEINNAPFTVHPNPANSWVKIETKNNELKELLVYNSIGQLFYCVKFNETAYQLNTSNWEAGFYTLTVKINNQPKEIKFIKID
ncbi:MAG: T9SS type A sorting domain-containing protein [Bacteroidetes bacterium]|nr:T9SS type A sorting domain-containing protein [Bacteroidota bacterium]MCA6443508.1 T9SS type A sorting domain-containing protein [Bacteroidota bacterium]